MQNPSGRRGWAQRSAIADPTGPARLGETDMKKAMADLKEPQTMPLDVPNSPAKNGTNVGSAILRDLTRHFQCGSADAARAIQQALDVDKGKVKPGELPHLADFGCSARSGLATIAAIGSGILAGLSEGRGGGREEARDKEG